MASASARPGLKKVLFSQLGHQPTVSLQLVSRPRHGAVGNAFWASQTAVLLARLPVSSPGLSASVLLLVLFVPSAHPPSPRLSASVLFVPSAHPPSHAVKFRMLVVVLVLLFGCYPAVVDCVYLVVCGRTVFSSPWVASRLLVAANWLVVLCWLTVYGL